MQHVELSTQSEGSAAGGRCVLKLWMADRELFQIAGNPPVKAYVESIAFRNTVLRRAIELEVGFGALAWNEQRLIPDVESPDDRFDYWQRLAVNMGIQARIVIPARAGGCLELQLQVLHEEAVGNAAEPPQMLPPSVGATPDPERNERLQALNTQLSEVERTLAIQNQQFETLENYNGSLLEKIRTLQRDNGNLLEKIRTLQRDNGNLQETIEALQRDNGNLRETIEALESKNRNLSGEIMVQVEEIKTRDKKIKTQQKQIRTQNKTVETLRSENGDLREKVKTLESENGNLRTINAEEDEKMDDLRTKNAVQGRGIEEQGETLSKLVDLAERGREVVLRGMLERRREMLFQDLTPDAHGQNTRDKLERLRKKVVDDVDKWVLAQYPTLSEGIHTFPTEDEAKYAIDLHKTTAPDDEIAKYNVLFDRLYGQVEHR